MHVNISHDFLTCSKRTELCSLCALGTSFALGNNCVPDSFIKTDLQKSYYRKRNLGSEWIMTKSMTTLIVIYSYLYTYYTVILRKFEFILRHLTWCTL